MALQRRPPLATLLLSLTSHAMFGAYPVFARVLLIPPVSFEPLDLLWLGAGFGTVLVLPPTLCYVGWRWLLNRSLLMFMVVSASRSITNVYAAKWTLAVYVQLLTLTTPFIVALLQLLLLRESIPPRFFTSVVLACIGSVLILSNNLAALDFSQLVEGTNPIGIAMGLASAVLLALYMLLMRVASKDQQHPMAALASQMIAMSVVPFLCSLAVDPPMTSSERWRPVVEMTLSHWFIFWAVVVLVYIVGNAINYQVITVGGAAYNASFMGFRLVVTVVLAWYALNEPLTSVWQGVGVVIVIASVTYFALGKRTLVPAPSSTEVQGPDGVPSSTSMLLLPNLPEAHELAELADPDELKPPARAADTHVDVDNELDEPESDTVPLRG